jgi:hypothetical protein
MLTVHSQTELVLNTHIVVSGVDHNVSKILNIVSNTGSGGARVREGTGCEDLSVSITYTLSITEQTLTVDKVSNLDHR